MKEIWKDIKGYEGIYQVSNLGSVRSLERKIMHGDGKPYTVKEKMLKPAITSHGYQSVHFSIDNLAKIFKVHRLVAEAFIENPNNLPSINHKDEIKTNNAVENLEWCTVQYNNTYGDYNRFGRKRNKQNLFADNV